MNLINETLDQPDKLKLPLDVFAITSFICAGFYVFLYSILIKQESFPLTSFPNRIIGIAVLEGTDTLARTHLYLYALILTGILALILLTFLEKTMNRIIPTVHYEKERFFLALISILGTANLIFGILTKNSVFLFNIYLIICILFCIITLIAAKKHADIKRPHNFQLFEDLPFIITIFLIPVPLLFVIQVLEGGAFVFTFFTFVEYYLLYTILLFALTAFCPSKLPRILDDKFRGILATSVIPLYFYPVSIPLTNEVQYTLSQWFSIDPKILSLVVLVLLVLISCFLYRIQIRQNHQFLDPQSSLNNLSLPALLTAVSLYANYLASAPFTSIGGGNLFEFGLTSTVVQQFFDFGKIPFVNIVNPHGFMDIYYAIFYSLINGYQPFDSFLWQWITPALIVLASYFFLKEFVEGHVALLLMLFLPVFTIFNFNNFFILIAGIFFVRFWKDPQLKNYIILLIALLFCFAWRAESGVSSVLAICFISVVLYFKTLKKSPSQLWKDYSKYFFATIGIFGICVLVYIAVCLITYESPVTAVQSVVNLYIINDPVGTYSGLYTVYDARVALQYAIFPLFGLGVVLFFIWIALTRRDHVTAQLILIAFLAIATLFLSQRGVQRHSLIEGFTTFYFPLLACSIPLLWYRSKKLLSIVIVILILGTGSFIAQYPLTPVEKDLSTTFFEFTTWENHESRVQVQATDLAPVAHLTEYLGTTLRPNETYFDISNFLMTYTLLQKDYVPDAVSNMLQAGEWYQNETVQRLIQNRDQIPIVVTGGLQIDNVPNEMRTYRIAEYVYTNYRPIGHIDTYEIWLRNDLNTSHFDLSSNQSYLIHFAAENLMSHDIQAKNQNGGIVLHSGSNDPYVWNFILNDTPVQQSDSAKSGFHLVYTSDTAGPLQVFYSVNNSPYSEEHSVVGFVNKANMEQDFYVILPTNIRFISNIRIDPPNNSNITLMQGYLYPQTSLLIPDTSINRDFDLKELPYVWGTFDKMDPATHQPVQNVLYDGEMQVDSNNLAVFTNISQNLDKTSGNYILIKLKSSRAGEVQMEYGNAEDTTGKPALMKFETIPSDKEQNYILRISSQWNWYSEPTTYIRISSSSPVTLYDCKILKGD